LNDLGLKRPAIVLNNLELSDNINKSIYKWSNIKEISFKNNKGKNAYGSHVAITFIDSKKNVQIPLNVFENDATEVFKNLTRYHKKYGSPSSG
jgi:hypothetical protein